LENLEELLFVETMYYLSNYKTIF